MIGIRVAVILLLAAAPAAAASSSKGHQFVRALDRMMVQLAPESARAGATMRRAYQEYLDLLMLERYEDLQGALGNGGLVPLPADPHLYNLAPRLDGPHPIGEKDLANQTSYVSARPATIGALLEIASRVKSGPVEVTSLVRHSHYQEELRATNANANTAVPTHTLGLAFDIGLVNSSLKTAREIRDVLRRMQRDGDILFIGERRQLVFHVVPHPSRLGHFTEVYMQKVGLPPTSRFAHVVAAGPAPVLHQTGPVRPSVKAEVLAVLPATAQPWGRSVVEAEPPPAPAPRQALDPAAVERAASSAFDIFQRWIVLIAALAGATWRITARRPLSVRLFE